MNVQAQARSSTVMRNQHNSPVLTAAALGGDSFVSFIRLQAGLPSGARGVVEALESRTAAGYRLDSVLGDVLRLARRTLTRHSKMMALSH